MGGTGSTLDRAEEATKNRVLAYLIDFFLLGTVATGVWFAGFFATGFAFNALGFKGVWVSFLAGFLPWLIIGAILFAYFAVLDARGGTIGKRLLELEVVTNDGGDVTIKETAIRTAVLLVPLPVMAFLSAIPGLGWFVGFPVAVGIMTAWLLTEAVVLFVTDGGQRLGDRAAGTAVVSSD